MKESLQKDVLNVAPVLWDDPFDVSGIIGLNDNP